MQILMSLSWSDIKTRALQFSDDWKHTTSERAESKSFWDAFFQVFGVRRQTFASFENPVKSLDKTKYGYIDLLWQGVMLVEHKSAGHDLEKARLQAMAYVHMLHESGRGHEAPPYVVVSDFQHFVLYNLAEHTELRFALKDLYRHVHAFGFIVGYRVSRYVAEDPINVKAAEIMAHLHDALRDGGYPRQDLDRLLTRILFCLFAEDTGIFDPNAFTNHIETHTREDGSDLGPALDQFFQILNKPVETRQKRLPETLRHLPYVNGQLFAERLEFAAFDAKMRQRLLACAHFDWSAISPAVFGSIFQGVMDRTERRQIGAHYTSEPDIMKTIRSAFLDDLERDLEARLKKSGKERQRALAAFQDHLASLRFLDPACGCGNFLILAYRELRRLEQEILVAQYGKTQIILDIGHLNRVSVNQFHGIEILEFPAEIARVSMWLMDHQMNVRLSEALGQYFVRLPLAAPPNIVCANALQTDWATVLDPSTCSYVIGNPPFVGKKARTSEQVEDMTRVFGAARGASVLDYVCAWYLQAARYVAGTKAEVAFVSTNSITQGEQPGLLWPRLREIGMTIQFAHRTFPWRSEARGKAHVHVVIIGFSQRPRSQRTLIEYEGDTVKIQSVTAINPYLIEGEGEVLLKRQSPLSPETPKASFGNMPNDGGHFLLDDRERDELIAAEPDIARYIHPFISAREFIAGEPRWCIWLRGASPAVVRKSAALTRRVAAVKTLRERSNRAATRKLAMAPMEFGEVRQPESSYVVIPRHPSERRAYVPMGYMPPQAIVADSCVFVEGASLYHFGVLMSAMHDAWIRQVCGRIKSDLRYSIELVYNNFPWPEAPSARRVAEIAARASDILDVRAAHGEASLADLYGELSTPRDLAAAHRKLDAVVDRCYGLTKSSPSNLDRVGLLFARWRAATQPLVEANPRTKRP